MTDLNQQLDLFEPSTSPWPVNCGRGLGPCRVIIESTTVARCAVCGCITPIKEFPLGRDGEPDAAFRRGDRGGATYA